MKIGGHLLEQVLGVKTNHEILGENMGLVGTLGQPNMVTFVDDPKFLSEVEENKNISAIFITKELASKLTSPTIKKIICDDPRFHFYTLLNHLAKTSYQKKEVFIHPTAKIHPQAYISDHNVEIGENVIVEPNATILADVKIGDYCIIRVGAIVGSEGFEHKKTTRGVVSVYHDGKVMLDNHVEIGASSCVDKGFSFRDTTFGEYTKLDNMVHVAHGVQIGKRCLLAANAMIAGSVTIGDDVWIGPSAAISNQITIGDNAAITIGAVVTRNVESSQRVTGNFAIEHRKFLNFLKSIR